MWDFPSLSQLYRLHLLKILELHQHPIPFLSLIQPVATFSGVFMITERKKLRIIAQLLKQKSEVQWKKDVSSRSRDQKGRFHKESRCQEKSKYESVRIIKLKKVKGSYGTYVIKTKILTESGLD